MVYFVAGFSGVSCFYLMLWVAVLFSFFLFNEISVTFKKKEAEVRRMGCGGRYGNK